MTTLTTVPEPAPKTTSAKAEKTRATIVAAADGTFSVDIALSIGLHNLTARSTDLAGNVSVLSDPLAITILDSTTSLIG